MHHVRRRNLFPSNCTKVNLRGSIGTAEKESTGNRGAIGGVGRLDRLKLLDHDGFGKAPVGPFLERRQRHHRVHITSHVQRHRNRIGAKAMHHRREHGVRRTKGAEQERPGLAVARAALGPNFLNPPNIGARLGRQFDCPDRPMQVHPAFVAQRGEARMHLGGNRPRMRPLRRILRPQPLFRKPLDEVFDDSKRIPDRDVVIDQHRHFAGTREIEDPLLVGFTGVERNEDLLERDVVGAKREPWPHRPRRIVLVADHKLQRHATPLLVQAALCHDVRPAFKAPDVLASGCRHQPCVAAFAGPKGATCMRAYLVDILAVGFFVLEWAVYALTLEHTAYGRNSLSARMHVYREVWVRRMLDREARMVDMQIMASLQNGTAFFASTSLFAVGGALALLRSTNEALAVLRALPIDLSPSPALWDIKCVGLILIFIYAFFKFAWAYRLFNYVAILLGSMPPASQRDTPQAEAHVVRTTRLFEAAGKHFNRGQRAFFFALGYLGWFVSPWVLFVSTAAVVIVTWRRQFASSAWRAMGS